MDVRAHRLPPRLVQVHVLLLCPVPDAMSLSVIPLTAWFCACEGYGGIALCVHRGSVWSVRHVGAASCLRRWRNMHAFARRCLPPSASRSTWPSSGWLALRPRLVGLAACACCGLWAVLRCCAVIFMLRCLLWHCCLQHGAAGKQAMPTLTPRMVVNL